MASATPSEEEVPPASPDFLYLLSNGKITVLIIIDCDHVLIPVFIQVEAENDFQSILQAHRVNP